MSMDGVLWQFKMTVEMRTQKSRMTRVLQRRIIARGGGEKREEGCILTMQQP